MKTVRILLLLVATFIVLVLLLLWIPVTSRFKADAHPAGDYAAALLLFDELQSKDGEEVLPECRSKLLTHGEAVTRTVVFIHGISNCPAQYELLSQRFYDEGYNVLVPRLPYHGYADRMSTDAAALTAEEMISMTSAAMDIAAGLGDHISVAGISTGGTLAAWVAEQRPDVDQTVLLSPFISPKAYPAWLIRPLMRVLLFMPNQFSWWNDVAKENLEAPRYTYPRYPSHLMAQIMRLSLSIRHQAQIEPPQSGSILVITNDGPRESVDNSVTSKLIKSWRNEGMEQIHTYQFDAALDLAHDYIDPGAPDQLVDVTQVIYPILFEQIDYAASAIARDASSAD